jgi:hypothetical protein
MVVALAEDWRSRTERLANRQKPKKLQVAWSSASAQPKNFSAALVGSSAPWSHQPSSDSTRSRSRPVARTMASVSWPCARSDGTRYWVPLVHRETGAAW